MEKGEKTLVKRAMRGNPKAFGTLVEREQEYLYRMAFLYVRQEQDALDVVQESILKAYKSLKTLREPEYFRTWLTKILINNAQSLPPSAPVEDTLYESMYLAWSTGTIGSLNFMQACFPYMKEQGEGRIINFASATGMFGYAGQLAYASNKESIRGLTKIAAKEWAKYGITVNVCLPGAESPAAKAWKEKFPDLYEKQMEQLPMHRLGDPETDIGAALTFLAGPDSKFYSGQSFILDGANSIMP